jgi:superfamily II DNA or RNA helicase
MTATTLPKREKDSVSVYRSEADEIIWAFSTYGWSYDLQWEKGIHKNGITKELAIPGTHRMNQSCSAAKTAIPSQPFVVEGSEKLWVIPTDIVGRDKSKANKFARKFDKECNRKLSKFKVKQRGDRFVGEEWYKLTPSKALAIREEVWEKLKSEEKSKVSEEKLNQSPVQLRGLQPLLVEKTLKFIKSGKPRGKGSAPTGLGKTVLAWDIITKAYTKGIVEGITVMTAPSQFLCNKNSEAFDSYNRRNGIRGIVNIPIFSGSDIGYFETVSELETRKEKLRAKIAGHLLDEGNKIVLHVCNNSMPMLNEVLRSLTILEIDFLIADEAHTLASYKNSKENVMGNSINFHLFDSNMRIKCRFFLTATEKNLLNPDILSSDQLNAYMNNPQFFGKHVFKVSYAEAVVAGHIVPFKVKIYEYGNRQKDVINLLKNGTDVLLKDLAILDDEGKTCKVNMKLVRVIVSALKVMDERRKLLIICHKNSHATLLEEVFKYLQENQGKLKNVSVDKVTTPDFPEPAKRLDEMDIIHESEEKHIIITGPWSITGVDCPSIDSILWAFTPGNEIRAFQGTGRGTRLSEGKEDLLVCFNLDLV